MMIHVLVVAPEPEIRQRIAATLNGGRFEVTEAAAPLEVKPGPYELVLVDTRPEAWPDAEAAVATAKSRAGGAPVLGVTDPDVDLPSALGSVSSEVFASELDAAAALLGSVLRGHQECKRRVFRVLDEYQRERDESLGAGGTP